jgi:hypothetical protein
LHIVLIPGFAGFDALGQLEYYAGVTPLFQQWKQSPRHRRNDVALHYFDNFPTAAVRTRATRLRSYLAKRIARGEFAPNDSVALIGHSTGGLDIRRLLWELHEGPDRGYPVDGATLSDHMVTAADILKLIHHVVFLSVPQCGTNIADWVRSYGLLRRLVITDLRGGFAGTQLPIVDTLQEWFWNYFSSTSRIGIVDAVRDVVSESETMACDNMTQVADAQEAASEVQLWLRHISSDFYAIEDLSVEGGLDSPARFDDDYRQKELADWKRSDIVTRSYATVGARPFKFTTGQPATRWELINPLSYPEVTPRERPTPKSDLLYRAAYRACAGGPFVYSNGNGAPVSKTFFPANPRPRKIELWDNDGIVNTASMFWPNGKDTLLVECDHLDIVGHYHEVRSACPGSHRRYQAYDLLKSGSNFSPEGFELVWNDVLDFCVT